MMTGPEKLAWREAFLNAFDENEWDDILLRLDDRRSRYYSNADPLEQRIGKVIDAYARQNRQGRLIARVIEARSDTPELLALARPSRATPFQDEAVLERIVKTSNLFQNAAVWLQKAGALAVCVCRIEIPLEEGMSYGTGFLIGSDLILTNYHVMEPVFPRANGEAGEGDPSKVICRFDYKVLSDGTKYSGTEFSLAPEWRVAHSVNNPPGESPTGAQLDFALIRLSKPAGKLPVGKLDAQGSARGWIPLPKHNAGTRPATGATIIILQHPEGEPLKLAFDTNAMLPSEPGAVRVRYTTNTDAGSSGSPCFDANLNLVALHHSGDGRVVAQYNEGIPIDLVVGSLVATGLDISHLAGPR